MKHKPCSVYLREFGKKIYTRFETLFILICVLLSSSVYLYRLGVMRMVNIRVYLINVEQYLYRSGQALSALGG